VFLPSTPKISCAEKMAPIRRRPFGRAHSSCSGISGFRDIPGEQVYPLLLIPNLTFLSLIIYTKITKKFFWQTQPLQNLKLLGLHSINLGVHCPLIQWLICSKGVLDFNSLNNSNPALQTKKIIKIINLKFTPTNN